MFVKILLCFAFLATVLSSTIKDFNNYEGPSPLYELPCMKYGGLCMLQDECPEGKQVGRKGLCPLRQDQGVECCYSAVRKSSTVCRSNGGECMPLSWNCPKQLQFSKATDCGHDEHCCILVNK